MQLSIQHTGIIPLHMAVEKGYIKLTELLLSRGADVNYVNEVNTYIYTIKNQ